MSKEPEETIKELLIQHVGRVPSKEEPNAERLGWKFDHPLAFAAIDRDLQPRLTQWIHDTLTPRKTENDRHTSYGLKHIAEAELNQYVSNGELKGAMLLSGYLPADFNVKNWTFAFKFVRHPLDRDGLPSQAVAKREIAVIQPLREAVSVPRDVLTDVQRLRPLLRSLGLTVPPDRVKVQMSNPPLVPSIPGRYEIPTFEDPLILELEVDETWTKKGKQNLGVVANWIELYLEPDSNVSVGERDIWSLVEGSVGCPRFLEHGSFRALLLLAEFNPENAHAKEWRFKTRLKQLPILRGGKKWERYYHRKINEAGIAPRAS